MGGKLPWSDLSRVYVNSILARYEDWTVEELL